MSYNKEHNIVPVIELGLIDDKDVTCRVVQAFTLNEVIIVNMIINLVGCLVSRYPEDKREGLEDYIYEKFMATKGGIVNSDGTVS